MPAVRSLGRLARGTAHGLGAVARGGAGAVRWTGGRAARFRARVAGGDSGLARLFDLHALAAAGDTLVAIGLAGTIFFVEPGEARLNVALYLLVTMVPFALLAPLIGPLLDHVRHGRRYALAATMLGRAVLAWVLADQLDAFALYPVAFGVLVLSRAYGVARAAAVPRVVPPSLTLSQANARGSVYGTAAGLVVLPLGLAAFTIGGGWPLRVAAVIFLAGMVVALRLPAAADSDRAEQLPRLFQALGLRLRHDFGWLRPRRSGNRTGRAGAGSGQPRHGEPILTGRLVTATLVGGVLHRALYGFLLVYLAFAIREGQLPTGFAAWDLAEGAALGLVSGALVAGTFLAVAAGSRLRIVRPLAVQAAGLMVVAMLAVAAAIWFRLPMVAPLCLFAAVSSGVAKLAVDAAIQERIPDRLRASAFAHSETLLMLAFVAGGAVGLIPVPGQVGMAVAAAAVAAATARAVLYAARLRRDRLTGRPHRPADVVTPTDPHPGTDPGATDPDPTVDLHRVPPVPTAPPVPRAAHAPPPRRRFRRAPRPPVPGPADRGTGS